MMVVVVSNHDATTDATGEEALFLLCMCHLFGWSKSYVQVFFFFSFFSATRPSLHSRGPGNNLWRLLGRGWRLGDEMYLSVFEGRMMSSSGCMNFSHRWVVKSFIFFSFFLSLESLIVSGCKI